MSSDFKMCHECHLLCSIIIQTVFSFTVDSHSQENQRCQVQIGLDTYKCSSEFSVAPLTVQYYSIKAIMLTMWRMQTRTSSHEEDNIARHLIYHRWQLALTASCFVCLVKVCLHIASRSRAATSLFVLLVPRHTFDVPLIWTSGSYP